MLKLICLALALVASLQSSNSQDVGVGKLKEVFAWKQISYNTGAPGLGNRYFRPPAAPQPSGGGVVFEGQEEGAGEQEAVEEENQDPDFYIAGNSVPMGVDRWKDRLFVTVPRRRPGIPATLNYVSLTEDKGNRSPDLRPYPDLASNTLGSGTPLVNVYRTRVDSCDRLWMVDTGILEIPGDIRSVQPPAIVIFDLNTNTLLHRYELKKDQDYLNDDPSGFASITVDIPKKDCSSAFAYLPDLVNKGVVVYSLKDDNSWRVRHNYFGNDPEEGDFDLNGLNFSWNDAVFSIALGPESGDGFRTAYFHAMASFRERAVSTAVLRNTTLASRTYHGKDFKALGYRGPNTQTTMHAVHPQTRVMFGGQVGSNALSCWNTRKPLSKSTLGIIAQDPVKFMYPSDLKIDQDTVWIMTNRLPRFIYSTLDPEEYNFRMYRVPVQDAIKGTVCA